MASNIMASKRMTSMLFLLGMILIAVGVSIVMKKGFEYFGGNEGNEEGFVEGLTLSADEIMLLQITNQYQVSDISLCLSAIYQIQPLVTDKSEKNQAYINKIILANLMSPANALYKIVNPVKDDKATIAAPSDYAVPDNVEAVITQIQPLRSQLCSGFIKSIFNTVPNLTTKQGNQAPSDQMLATQLESYQKKAMNGNAPLPGIPSTSATSPPNDIVSFIIGHYYETV